MSGSDVDDVIGACEFIFQQVGRSYSNEQLYDTVFNVIYN